MSIKPEIGPVNPSLFGKHRVFSLPEPLVKRFRKDALLRDLFPIWAGYFEKAKTHGIHRPKGINNHLAILCVAGTGMVFYADKKWRVSAGELFFLEANQPHAYLADSKNPWTILWVHFVGDAVNRFWQLSGFKKNLLKTGPVLRPEDPETLVALRKSFEKIIHTYESGFGFLECLKAGLYLREIFLRVAEFGTPQNPSKNTGTKPAVETILQLMKDKVRENFALEDMASGALLSVTHFSRLFRAQTGFSPTDYFIRLKISQASQKLLATTTGVREIAHEFGFEDEYYFSRIFKKITGQSPRHYRESHRV